MTEREAAHVLAAAFEEHYQRLVSLAWAMTSDIELAHDLVQEAFAQPWRSWAQVGTQDEPLLYLRGVVVHLVGGHRRRRRLDERLRALWTRVRVEDSSSAF